MSLDVYLTTGQAVDARPPRERIFVRRGGATEEVTRDEWDALNPGREPVVVMDDADGEVYTANITHNLGRMASECGLYEPLWRPDENGITAAYQLIGPLTAGLARLRDERARLLEFNPKNGWGDYDLLLRFTERYLEACEEYPHAEVEVSR